MKWNVTNFTYIQPFVCWWQICKSICNKENVLTYHIRCCFNVWLAITDIKETHSSLPTNMLNWLYMFLCVLKYHQYYTHHCKILTKTTWHQIGGQGAVLVCHVLRFNSTTQVCMLSSRTFYQWLAYKNCNTVSTMSANLTANILPHNEYIVWCFTIIL